MRRVLFALLIILAWTGYAEAQGTIYNLSPPAPNAQLRVCHSPDNGYPCPVTAAIFSDVGLTQSIAQPVQLGPSGFATFYIASGTYVIQLSGPGYGAGNRTTVSIGGSGSGITSVSSLPATCTPGTSFVNLTINGTGYGTFFCAGPPAPANTWVPENPSQTVSPLAYGAKWDARFTYDAVFTITNPTITCAAGDCNFTAADVGKVVFGWQSGNSANNLLASYVTLLAQTTILTVNSATSITVNANALASCNGGGTLCILAWGTQDDATAINLAATAAWSTPGACKAVQFPEGNAFIGGPIMNIGSAALSTPCGGWVVASGNSGIDTTQVGPEVFGQGPGNTVLIPLPSYNYAGCTNGASGQGCNFTTPNLEAHDFGINGLGQATITGNPAMNLVEMNGSAIGGGCTGSTGFNLSFANWAVKDANAVGFDMGRNSCGDPVYFNDISELFGSIPCQATSAGVVMQLAQLACFGGNNASTGNLNAIVLVNVNGQPSIINSNGGYYGQQLAAGPTITVGGSNIGIFNSTGDLLNCAFTTACTGLKTICSAACTVNITNDSIGMNSGAAGGAAFWLSTGSGTSVHVRGTAVKAAGAANQFLITVASSQFYDDGGNSFTQGGAANSIVAGTYFGSNSVTGTTITAAKLVLSAGWGASAAWTALSGNTRLVQGTITNTGAGQAANPTITYTFPTPFVDVSSVVCKAFQVGGTQTILAATEFLTPSALSTTSVVFTYNGTPTVNLTEVMQIECDSK
jgi:hypothetical protein